MSALQQSCHIDWQISDAVSSLHVGGVQDIGRGEVVAIFVHVLSERRDGINGVDVKVVTRDNYESFLF